MKYENLNNEDLIRNNFTGELFLIVQKNGDSIKYIDMSYIELIKNMSILESKKEEWEEFSDNDVVIHNFNRDITNKTEKQIKLDFK